MDFAIVETGGKQYKVSPGATLRVEKMAGKAGDTMVFDKVLMMVTGDTIEVGTPYLSSIKVEAEVSAHEKGEKIRTLRFKAKSRYRRHRGHRQQLTKLVVAGGATETKSVRVLEKPESNQKKPAKTTKANANKPKKTSK